MVSKKPSHSTIDAKDAAVLTVFFNNGFWEKGENGRWNLESGSVTEQQQGTVINGRTLEDAPVKHFENAVIREVSPSPPLALTPEPLFYPQT